MLIWLACTRKTGQWRPLWVSLSIIGYSYIANFVEINKNDFKKNIQILNDQRRTTVPYFGSKNRTLLIYTIFRLVFALISLNNDALKFFIFVIPSISFSKYRINSFQNKHWKVAKYTNQSCKIVTNVVNRHQTAWLFPELCFNRFHCLIKNCFWHSINLRRHCSTKSKTVFTDLFPFARLLV